MKKMIKVNGKFQEMYTIEEIANRLGRQPQTVRKWEKQGLLPVSQYKIDNNRRFGGYTRLYTLEQVIGIVDVIEHNNFVQGTNAADRKKISQELLLAMKK